MAYTKTIWSTGDTITATLMNNLETQYDEARTELAADSSDIPVRASNLTNLTDIDASELSGAAGAPGQILTTDGTGLSWDDPPDGATKEVFIPVTDTNTRGTEGSFTGGKLLGTGEYALMVFKVPHDFSSIVTAQVIGICLTGGADPMRLYVSTDYGGLNQAYDTHEASSVDLASEQDPAVTDDLISWDISSALASLAAADYVGLRVQGVNSSTGVLETNALILGVRLRYS